MASFPDHLCVLLGMKSVTLPTVFPTLLSFCSVPKTSGGDLVYTKASVKLIYILEIFLAVDSYWRGVAVFSLPRTSKGHCRVSIVRVEDE